VVSRCVGFYHDLVNSSSILYSLVSCLTRYNQHFIRNNSMNTLKNLNSKIIIHGYMDYNIELLHLVENGDVQKVGD